MWKNWKIYLIEILDKFALLLYYCKMINTFPPERDLHMVPYHMSHLPNLPELPDLPPLFETPADDVSELKSDDNVQESILLRLSEVELRLDIVDATRCELAYARHGLRKQVQELESKMAQLPEESSELTTMRQNHLDQMNVLREQRFVLGEEQDRLQYEQEELQEIMFGVPQDEWESQLTRLQYELNRMRLGLPTCPMSASEDNTE